MTALLWLTTIAVLLLLGAAGYLVYLNWSVDVFLPQLISAIGAGALTLIVTLLATSKEYAQTSKISTVVLISDATGRPPHLRAELAEALLDPSVEWANALASAALEAPGAAKGKEFDYAAELVQYEILGQLRDLQRQGTGIVSAVGAQGALVSPGGIIPKPPDISALPPEDITGLASNRFSQGKAAAFQWETMGGLRVPAGTKVALSRDDKTSTLKLSKPNFFDIEIQITPIIGGKGTPPANTQTHPPGGNLTMYVLDVTIDTRFNKLTSGNWRTDDYKKWAAWIAATLEQKCSVKAR